MTSARHLRWAIRAFGGVVLAVLAAVLVVHGMPGGGGDPAANTVLSYVKARRAGDATKACEQLSRAERRDLVARITRTPPAEASGRDCERHVLSASRWSDLTRPALATFRVAGAEARIFAADVRLVTPSGFDLPIVEVSRRDGEWKIDTQAAERSTFLKFCGRDGAAAEQCGCVFDHARARDPRLLRRTSGVMDLFRDFESGRRKRLFAAVNRRCAGNPTTMPARFEG